MSDPAETISSSPLQDSWAGRYAKLIAIALLYGATVHISNMAGLSGTPWLSTPLLWRAMDVLLLAFDLVAGIGLWQGAQWSIWLVFGGILLLQFVPYTLLRSHFILNPEDAQTLNGLLGTESLLLAIFALLLWLRK
ncbi:MAG: hypothetical protein AAFQ89_09105 [Cyanobacteria bacterium J06626_18]